MNFPLGGMKSTLFYCALGLPLPDHHHQKRKNHQRLDSSPHVFLLYLVSSAMKLFLSLLPICFSRGHPFAMPWARSEIGFKDLPTEAAQIGEPPSVVQKTAAQDLGDTKNDVPLGHSLNNVAAQPITEFHHSLLMAREAKMPLLAGKGQ